MSTSTAPPRTATPGRLLARWARSLRGAGGLRIVAAIAGGLALYASYAPSTQWWAAIVGIALLGLSVHGVRGRSGYGLALVFGAAFYLPLLGWTSVYVGDLPWFALAIAEALMTGLVGILLAWAANRLPAWPVWASAAWVAGETLRARFPFGGFPWGSVAFSQPDGPLLPVASLLGSAGLTFVTVLAGFSISMLLRQLWRHRGTVDLRILVPPAVLLLIVVALGAAGRISMVSLADAASYPHRTIAVIQGNVPEPGLEFNARRRAVTDNHAERTHDLAAAVRAGTAPKPDLVIWPENSSDIDPYRNADAAQVISSAVDDIGVPVLIGAVVGTDQPNSYYNMGIVWYPHTGPGETYTKRHPVPFGEYMPYRSFFRIFSDKVDLLTGQFLPGNRVGNFDVAGIPFGDLICFEVVYDSLTRDVINGGARLLVVQTNNATFGWTNETYQQQAMSRVRAVEHGRAVLISATSGVSAVIRPDGSVESRIPLFTAGYLTPSVPLIDRTTPGTVLGAPVEWLTTLATPLALLWLFVVDGRRRGRQPHSTHPIDHRTAGDDTQEDASP